MSKHCIETAGYELLLQINLLPEGKYLATSTSLPGLVAQGDTWEETEAIARDVAKQIIALKCERGQPLPKSLKPLSSHFEIKTAIAV